MKFIFVYYINRTLIFFRLILASKNPILSLIEWKYKFCNTIKFLYKLDIFLYFLFLFYSYANLYCFGCKVVFSTLYSFNSYSVLYFNGSLRLEIYCCYSCLIYFFKIKFKIILLDFDKDNVKLWLNSPYIWWRLITWDQTFPSKNMVCLFIQFFSYTF